MSDKVVVKAGNVMTPNVKTIEGTQTVDKAIEMMRNSGVSSLIVDRRDTDDQGDRPQQGPLRVGIYEIMTKPVLTVMEDMDIRYAVRLLGQFSLSRALVIDDQRNLKGIVTLRDMVLRHSHEGG
jgi:CBS domain-containing protein